MLSDLAFPSFDLLSEACYVLSPQINTFPLFLPLPNNIPRKAPPLGNPDHPSLSAFFHLFITEPTQYNLCISYVNINIYGKGARLVYEHLDILIPSRDAKQD